jgi:1,4-alpha-glucan branching enzyme
MAAKNEPQPELPALDSGVVAAIISGSHPQPHSFLGRHAVDGDSDGDSGRTVGSVVRVVRPLASAVAVLFPDGTRCECLHLVDGLWQGFSTLATGPYTVETTYAGGESWTADDAYRFAPSIGDIDLYLWAEGRHEQLWQVLGAHYRSHEEVWGTSFTVWAPHARAARVVGDFNAWNGVAHALRRLDDNGVWELFVPGIEPGTCYKFELLTQAGEWVTRADPMARYTEIPPATASKVGHSLYEWADASWLEARAARDPHNSPMSVYELHFASWRPGLSYRAAAQPLIDYIIELGFTHVEFMPLAEHPFGPSWGYQVTGYFAPTSRFGHPDDLKYLIDQLHQAGIGVIMDWVPGHFPKDEWALASFDGEPVYEHPDPRRGEQKDWGTLIFDFGQTQVRNFLVANALYWLEEFHIDGLRVDAVASMLYLDYSRDEGEWLPNIHGGRENLEAISLLQEVNATAYKRNLGVVMIAEESTSWAGVTRATAGGGLGFGLKWNMGWMNDSLEYIQVDPLYRSHHHRDITFSFEYALSENFLLPISHDEVVHGKGSLLAKMPGDQWQKLANVRAYLAFMWAHPGKKLLFMGQEFGQPSEWSEERGLDWWILEQPVHQGLSRLVSELNRVYRENASLWSRDNEHGGFEFLDGGDAEHNIVSFLRWDHNGNPVAVLMNFSGNTVGPYRVGLPHSGVWEEIINTDASDYGGSGVGNFGTVQATDQEWGGRPASAEVVLPPLAGLWLKLRR